MAKEDDYPYPTQALPTPTDTPYRTPSRSVSRRCSPSPGPSSSPSTFLPNTDSYFRGQGEPKDVANDENISILDPRRFTPSLHASLVSEILYRRRDLESKTGLIENLESTLYAARNENNTLNETLTSNVNEIRSLKHQLQLLESGSLSAAEELAEERDEALASLADTRQRLEASKKKVRGLEEEAERTHALWDGDQRNWEGERRNLERKVHVAEARLKTVLAEIAAAQANDQSQGAESDGEEMTEDLRSGSALGRRAMSNISNGTRFSMLSGPNGYGGGKMYGLSLADELALDEEEGEDSQDSDLDGGRISPDALPEERSERRASSIMTREDQKARKVLGLPIEPTQESAATIVSEPSTTEKPPFPDSDEKTTVTDELQYIDTGVQFSPPASPEPDAVSNDRHEERIPSAIEQGANQCRKRTSISPVTPVDQSGITSSTQMSACMVSSAAQTIGDLPSPPSTPRDSLSTISQGHDSCPVAVEMSSSSTQTEETNASSELRVSNASTPLSPPVPTITIHPPLSAPSSPRNSVVLPPHTKSTACQASIASSVKLRSISVQTEEIRIDNRAIKLPAKLLPSAISSQPPTPQPSDLEEDPESLILNSPKSATDAGPNSQNHPPVRPPPPQPRQSSSDSEGAYSRKNDRGPLSWTEPSAIWRPVRSSSSKLEGAGPNQSEEAYPGKNDNGPLDPARPEKIRRPFRTSSLFAGFDTGSDEDAGHCGETEMSDDDFRNAAPIRKTLSKVHNAWKLVPQSPRPLFGDNEIREVDEEEGAKHGHKHTGRDNAHVPIAGRGLSAERQLNAKSTDLVSKWSHNTKQPDMRKTALISNGTAAHSQRSRSPSLPTSNSTTTTVAAPPFPVPTRSSSRRPPLSASDGAQSPTPYSGGMNPGNQHREPSRPPTKKYIIRKVRSAAAIAHNENHERNNSQSTPPMSASSAAPDSPQHPPMPMNAMNSTRYGHVAQLYKHDQRPSTGTTDAGNNTVDSSVQQTSVVDAIAQTMVGEWMWKYVRRRKSFGVAESPQADWEVGKSATDGSTNTTGTGIRHKRWVWVAPYERAVMWSSKQPTSGSALLGKSGRKCRGPLKSDWETQNADFCFSDDSIGLGC